MQTDRIDNKNKNLMRNFHFHDARAYVNNKNENLMSNFHFYEKKIFKKFSFLGYIGVNVNNLPIAICANSAKLTTITPM